MTPPQVPLSDVPVGVRVLHEGRLWRANGVTSPAFPDQSVLAPTRDGRGFGSYQASCAYLSLDTLVTSLVGDAPRLLTNNDIGTWVYVVDWGRHSLPHPTFLVARRLRDGGYVDADGWEVAPDWPVWIVQPALEAEPALRAVAARQDRETGFISPERPSAQPAPEAVPAEARWGVSDLGDGSWTVGTDRHPGVWDAGSEESAQVLAAILNEHAPDGLPEPQPERPTVDVIADGLEAGIPLEYALAEHGYAVVDRLDPEVAKAIGWLEEPKWALSESKRSASALLRALGQEAPDA